MPNRVKRDTFTIVAEIVLLINLYMKSLNHHEAANSAPKRAPKVGLKNDLSKSLAKRFRGMLTAVAISTGALNSSCLTEAEAGSANQEQGVALKDSTSNTQSQEKIDYNKRFSSIVTDGKGSWYVQISYPKPFVVEAYLDGEFVIESDVINGKGVLSSKYQSGQELNIKPFEVDENGEKIRQIPVVHDPALATEDTILGYDYGNLP